jgi:Spy/CpxP family protein refolding chaperone
MTTRAVRRVALISLLSLTGSALLASDQRSPYVGLQDREIKALSPEQIEQYRAGEGMGFGLAAELNDYPGPRHVLELAAELELSAEQRAAVQAAYDAMHTEAVRLGEAIVERERRLDELFADGAVTPEALRATLEEIGLLQAELRFVHLAAHLETQRILTREQVERYGHLRGYAGGAHPHHGHGHG